VLWYNLLPVVNGAGQFDSAYYAVATSENPEGPFRTVNSNVTGLAYTKLPDSPSIFVDDDGKGYIAFTHEDTHINHVQLLTDDLLGPAQPSQVSAQIGAGNNEGVLMFKRAGMYYVGFGQCCCFCGGGSNVDLWMSASPLGPYTAAGTLIKPGAWGAQTGAIWATGGGDYVLFGDRWQSAPDHIKGHDFS
jgi:beta-xylosidase